MTSWLSPRGDPHGFVDRIWQKAQRRGWHATANGLHRGRAAPDRGTRDGSAQHTRGTPHAPLLQPETVADASARTADPAPRLYLVRCGGLRTDELLSFSVERSAHPVAVGGGTAISGVDTDVPEGVCAARRHAGGAGERDPLRLRALAMGVPYLHLPAVLPSECRGLLDIGLARELRAVPIGRTADALTVALDARWDARMLFRLRAATGLIIFPVLTLSTELESALAQLQP